MLSGKKAGNYSDFKNSYLATTTKATSKLILSLRHPIYRTLLLAETLNKGTANAGHLGSPHDRNKTLSASKALPTTAAEAAILVTEDALAKTKDALANADDALARIEHAFVPTEAALAVTEDALAQTKDVLANKEHSAGKIERAFAPTEDALSETKDALATTKSVTEQASLAHVEEIKAIQAITDTAEDALAIAKDALAKAKAAAALAAEQASLARIATAEANNTKTCFLQNLSHELRTPLNGLLGFSEILMDELEGTTPESRKMAKFVNTSAHRLAQTLMAWTDHASAKAGGLNPCITEIDAGETVRNAVQKNMKYAESKHLALDVKTSIRTTTLANEEYLYKAVFNIVENAIKFTKTGSVSVTLGAADIDGVAYTSIKISDTGIGIKKELLAKMFEAFEQASTGHNREFEGNGLGLTNAKDFVELMNGKITLKSEAGRGTVVEILLPAASKIDGASVPQASKAIKSVLIVEDTPDSMLLMQHMLESSDALESTGAENGLDALELAKKEKFDIVILDITLTGGMSGLGVLKQLRKMPDYKNTPIIACTAYGMTGDRERFLKDGFDEYVSKPFSKEILLEALDRAVKISEKRGEKAPGMD